MENLHYFEKIMNAVQNLVDYNFSAVFNDYSSVEIGLYLHEDIYEYIKFATENKMLFGVYFAEQALNVLASEDFIRQEIKRQFEDEIGSLIEFLPIEQEKAEELAWEDRYYSKFAHANLS